MDEAQAIAQITKSTSMVHVADPRAYDVFKEGGTIFDVNPRAALLEEFAARNKSEFYPKSFVGQMADFAPSRFRGLVAPSSPTTDTQRQSRFGGRWNQPQPSCLLRLSQATARILMG